MELVGKVFPLLVDSNMVELEGRTLAVSAAHGQLWLAHLRPFRGLTEEHTGLRVPLPQYSYDCPGPIPAGIGKNALMVSYRWVDKLVALPYRGGLLALVLGIDTSTYAAYFVRLQFTPMNAGSEWVHCQDWQPCTLPAGPRPLRPGSSLRPFPPLGPGALLYSAGGGPELYRLALEEGGALSATRLPADVPGEVLLCGAALATMEDGRAFLIGGMARDPVHYVNTVLELRLRPGPEPGFSWRVLASLPAPGLRMPGCCTLLGRYIVVFGGSGGSARDDMFVVDAETGGVSAVLKPVAWAPARVFPALRVSGRYLLVAGGLAADPATAVYRLDLYVLAGLLRDEEMGRRLGEGLRAAGVGSAGDSRACSGAAYRGGGRGPGLRHRL